MRSYNIVGHIQPDVDCLTGMWLIMQFWLNPGRLNPVFVAMNNPDAATIRDAYAVVDVDGSYDPRQMRFDHHQDRALPCAAQLVWNHINQKHPHHERGWLDYLAPFIEVVNAIDMGLPHAAAEWSKLWGIHGIVHGIVMEREDSSVLFADPAELLQAFSVFMNPINRNLRHQYRATHEWKKHIRLSLHDGDIVVLENSNSAITKEALKAYPYAVFHSQDGDQHAIGLVRAAGQIDTHVLVTEAIAIAEQSSDLYASAAVQEFRSWYNDQRGFFSGRTPKGGAHTTHEPLVDVNVIGLYISLALDSLELHHE